MKKLIKILLKSKQFLHKIQTLTRKYDKLKRKVSVEKGVQAGKLIKLLVSGVRIWNLRIKVNYIKISLINNKEFWNRVLKMVNKLAI